MPSLSCPTCGHREKVPGDLAGRLVRCGTCGARFAVAGGPLTAVAATPAPSLLAPAASALGGVLVGSIVTLAGWRVYREATAVPPPIPSDAPLPREPGLLSGPRLNAEAGPTPASRAVDALPLDPVAATPPEATTPAPEPRTSFRNALAIRPEPEPAEPARPAPDRDRPAARQELPRRAVEPGPFAAGTTMMVNCE